MNEPNRKNSDHILIIEDNDTFRKMLRIRLESLGFQVSTAEDGLEGLNMARTVNPDLILLDLMLPKMDGHNVCRLLKFDQKYRHIPIVILTARDLENDAERAKEHGADAYIVKTTRHEIMLDVIQKLLVRNG